MRENKKYCFTGIPSSLPARLSSQLIALRLQLQFITRPVWQVPSRPRRSAQNWLGKKTRQVQGGPHVVNAAARVRSDQTVALVVDLIHN
jgi:hypothetical protein